MSGWRRTRRPHDWLACVPRTVSETASLGCDSSSVEEQVAEVTRHGFDPRLLRHLGLDWAKALVRHHTQPWVKRHQTVDLEGGELEVEFTVKPVARGRDGVSGVSLACPFRVSMLTQPLRATPCERPCNQADTGRPGQGTRFVACGEDTGGRHCRDPWPALSLIPS